MGQSGLCLPRIELTGGDGAQGRKAEVLAGGVWLCLIAFFHWRRDGSPL